MARWRVLLAVAVMASFCLVAMARDTNRLATRRTPVVEWATGVDSHGHTSPLDDIIYYEDWESGDLAGWTPVDVTATPSAWHRDDYNAFGGSGMSWWMGDSTVMSNGGYLDEWYMVLDSPPVALGATPTLRFWHRRSSEPPTPPMEPGYDGWDGQNLRISTNNGVSWTVIPGNVITPTYTANSLYSFGFQHGESLNVPGWDSTSATWHQVIANLAQWANQTVKIRWAFASDPYYSTPQDPSMFGWMVDAIRVYNGPGDTVLTTDANADDGFTPGTNVPTGGNLWRIATDNSSPAGPHIVVCNNASNNQYNPYMNNELISPPIDCSNLANGVLMADFQLTGALSDDFADYWTFEVSTNGGASWCHGSNPTCDSSGQNFIYPNVPADWASFNESYPPVILDMSALIGNVLTFKFTFETNADADVDVGPKFDGFSLTHTAALPNDVTCYSLQVRYPNMVNRPTRIRAYFRNMGNEPEANFPAGFRVGSAAPQLFPSLTLDPNATATRDTVITFTIPVLSEVRAYTALAIDDSTENDTSLVDSVDVQPFSNALEIGYDNRTIRWRFEYPAGSGALVHFTPHSDGVAGTFSVTSIRAKFDVAQPADLPIQLHVYLGGLTQPGTEVVDQTVIVLDGEADPDVWKVINTSGISQLQNLNDDYWVWFEVLNPDPVNPFPEILGENEEPWSDIHNYTYEGSGAATRSYFFYQIHSVIDVGTAAGEVPGELPTVWALEQNYPNPFNPATDIRYSVPKAERMTLKVFNVVGQEVATLMNGVVQPGVYTARFDASKLPSGLYFYRLESESFTSSRKMLLLK